MENRNLYNPTEYVVIPRAEYVELITIKAAHDLEEYKSKYWGARVEIDELKDEIKALKGQTDETVEENTEEVDDEERG